jgi:NAD-dependent dihydropyrimidine dehydrogenase PreA subunit
MTDIYQRLAKHLDNLPAGFPATESGVELRILKRLFSPQEAEIALGLNMMLEPVDTIAERLSRHPEDLAPILEEMSHKGLIFRSFKDGNNLFMAAQFVIGIWEYHVNDLDEDLIKDFNEYVPYLMDNAWVNRRTKQLRVIPVSKSLNAEMKIMPYEAAEEIIGKQSKIVVAPCICRKEHNLVGDGCNKLMEACLIFGSGAYYYEQNGLGRTITKQEALDIVGQALEAGLVLQPGNAQQPANICMCCGCCCQILRNLNRLDAPAKAVVSNYFAVVDEESCTACGVCEERCQMAAIEISDTATVNLDRCIGCGLCVPTCDYDAIHLEEKQEGEKVVPPKNVVGTYLNLAKERGLI